MSVATETCTERSRSDRLISVTKTGFSAPFVFDSDGNRFKSTVAGEMTVTAYDRVGNASTRAFYVYPDFLAPLSPCM